MISKFLVKYLHHRTFLLSYPFLQAEDVHETHLHSRYPPHLHLWVCVDSSCQNDKKQDEARARQNLAIIQTPSIYSMFIGGKSHLLIWMTCPKWLIKAFFSNNKKKLMYKRVKDHKKWESQVLVVVFLRRIRKCSINNNIYYQKQNSVYHILWKLFSLFFFVRYMILQRKSDWYTCIQFKLYHDQ